MSENNFHNQIKNILEESNAKLMHFDNPVFDARDTPLIGVHIPDKFPHYYVAMLTFGHIGSKTDVFDGYEGSSTYDHRRRNTLEANQVPDRFESEFFIDNLTRGIKTLSDGIGRVHNIEWRLNNVPNVIFLLQSFGANRNLVAVSLKEIWKNNQRAVMLLEYEGDSVFCYETERGQKIKSLMNTPRPPATTLVQEREKLSTHLFDHIERVKSFSDIPTHVRTQFDFRLNFESALSILYQYEVALYGINQWLLDYGLYLAVVRPMHNFPSTSLSINKTHYALVAREYKLLAGKRVAVPFIRISAKKIHNKSPEPKFARIEKIITPYELPSKIDLTNLNEKLPQQIIESHKLFRTSP